MRNNNCVYSKYFTYFVLEFRCLSMRYYIYKIPSILLKTTLLGYVYAQLWPVDPIKNFKLNIFCSFYGKANPSSYEPFVANIKISNVLLKAWYV